MVLLFLLWQYVGISAVKRNMSQVDFTIRAATQQDLHHIEALIHAIAEYEELSHEVAFNRESLLKYGFSENPENNVFKCLLVEHVQNNQVNVIGFALYYLTFSSFLGKPGIYLEDLFVQPASRGLGVGKLLFKALMQEVIHNGYGRFEWQVLNWNQSAIDFYKSMGAKRLDGWHVYRMTLPEVVASCQALA